MQVTIAAIPRLAPVALLTGILFFGGASLPAARAGTRGEIPDHEAGRVRVYELYARVTAYHNGPGDSVNGGPLNFMGRLLVTGRSAAGPSSLAGSLVEVPDFHPETESDWVSPALRRFITDMEYDGFFVLDDIGTAITFLRGGRQVRGMEGMSLGELSRYSLSRREAVLDLDIMVPDAVLAEDYENPLCRVRVYQAEAAGVRWIHSPSPIWQGRKPFFDTVLRHAFFMHLIENEPLVADAEPWGGQRKRDAAASLAGQESTAVSPGLPGK